ncbi:MAG: hypothetical protein PHC34_07595 [Candidatus Gastranaerophilales bacterium]|nr:hypothetical protein [Candidatus Gastranaerophilales bacterium]
MFKKIFTISFILGFNIFLCIQSTIAQNDAVIVNIKKLVYHKTTCSVAKRCKKSCIKTTLPRALNIYHARPCKICHKKHKKSD